MARYDGAALIRDTGQRGEWPGKRSVVIASVCTCEAAMIENEPTAPTEPRQRRPRSETAAPLWLTAGAPVLLSLLSLGLSFYTIVEANRAPAVWLSAPDVVRIAAGEQTWFYVQARLVSAARNDRVAVITGLRLEVAAPDGEPPGSFVWDEQGTWQYDTVNQGLTWIYQADAAPLVVGPSSPQLPICLFLGPFGWSWQPGTYEVTIVASRGKEVEPLRTSFAMTLLEQIVEEITSQPRSWREVRTEVAPTPA